MNDRKTSLFIDPKYFNKDDKDTLVIPTELVGQFIGRNLDPTTMMRLYSTCHGVSLLFEDHRKACHHTSDQATKALLHYVLEANRCGAKNILNVYNSFGEISCYVLQKNSGKEEHCGRQWKKVSPLEYAAWAGNMPMVKLLLSYVPDKYIAVALQQLKDVRDKGTEHGMPLSAVRYVLDVYEENNNTLKNPNILPPTSALQEFKEMRDKGITDENWLAFINELIAKAEAKHLVDRKKFYTFDNDTKTWVNKVGMAQKALPRNVLQGFFTFPAFNASLEVSYRPTEIYFHGGMRDLLDEDVFANLGETFALCRGQNTTCYSINSENDFSYDENYADHTTHKDYTAHNNGLAQGRDVRKDIVNLRKFAKKNIQQLNELIDGLEQKLKEIPSQTCRPA